MKNNHRHQCEHCGTTFTVYRFALPNRLLSLFQVFAESYLEDPREICLKELNKIYRAKKGKDIDYTTRNNFNKLEQFGVITRDKKNRKWVLSFTGDAFYHGEQKIPDAVFIRSASNCGKRVDWEEVKDVYAGEKPRNMSIFDFKQKYSEILTYEGNKSLKRKFLSFFRK